MICIHRQTEDRHRSADLEVVRDSRHFLDADPVVRVARLSVDLAWERKVDPTFSDQP